MDEVTGRSLAHRLGRRTSVLFAVALAVGALGTGAVTYAVAELAWNKGGSAGGEATIPRTVGSPGPLTTPVGWSAPGAASVLFSERSGRLVTVGLAADDYRVIRGRPADPGRTALLSLDGSRVALAAGGSVDIVDLMTGADTTIQPATLGSDHLLPEAWLPDDSMVLLAKTYAKDPKSEGIVQRLGVLSAPDGTFEEFASATYVIASPGFAVAVSPDGFRIAYQYERIVTVYDRRTRTKVTFDLPPQAVLAGKGAWTPDGARITIARVDPQNGREWSLSFVDPATGRDIAVDEKLSIKGAALIRVIGWNRQTQRPIVVAYEAPHAPTWDLAREISITVTPEQVSQVAVYELNTQGVGPTVILEAVGDVNGIDIATVALDSQRFRAGGPPRQLTPLALGLGGCVALVVGVVGVFWARYGRPRVAQNRSEVAGEEVV